MQDRGPVRTLSGRHAGTITTPIGDPSARIPVTVSRVIFSRDSPLPGPRQPLFQPRELTA
jgi:hypothetical protein